MNEHMRVPIVHVQFCPTVPHCSLASMIGLCIRTRLQECIADEYKVLHVVRLTMLNED